MLFLCIIMSAVILSQSILYRGVMLRSDEVELTRAAHLQAENILSGYNRVLLKHYGVYCYEESVLNRLIFDTCCRVDQIETFEVSAGRRLSSDDLGKIINDYMKTRFPAMMGNELLTRIGSALGNTRDSDLIKKAEKSGSGILKSYMKEYLSSTDNWASIFDNIENFIDLVDYDNKLADFKDFIDDLKETMKRVGTLKLQDGKGAIKLDFFDPDSIAQLFGVLSCSIDSDAPDFLSYLYINKYAASLFDSVLESVKSGTITARESNIFGTSFIDINGENKADIEHLLTGKQGSNAVNISKTLVFSARALLNLGAFLLDEDKLSKSEGVADIVAVCVAALSSGTIVIDPSVIKYLVIVTWALQQSITDLNVLMKGGEVTVINHSSLNDKDGVKASMSTSYRDYLEIFLLFVPRDLLLKRMIDIFERYSTGGLYVSVYTTARYKGREFMREECYDSYRV